MRPPSLIYTARCFKIVLLSSFIAFLPTPSYAQTDVMVTPGPRWLRVNWEASADADGYKVQWKSGMETFATAAADGREASVSPGSTTSYKIQDLTNGTAYEVRVIATKINADDGTPSTGVAGTPMARAKITRVWFPNATPDTILGLGDKIEVRIKFDTAVEVTGKPRVAMTLRIGHGQTIWAIYKTGASTDTELVFRRVVTGNDDDYSDNVRISSDAVQYNGGTIWNKGTTLNADLSHGLLLNGPNFRTRWVESIEVISDPAVPKAVTGVPVYGPGETVRFRVWFEHSVNVDQTGGAPNLKFRSGSGSADYTAAYESNIGTRRLEFAWTAPAVVPGDGAGLVVPSNGLVLSGGTIKNNRGIVVNIRHGQFNMNTQVDTTAPELAAGADGATVDGTALVLTFQNPDNGNPDHLDEDTAPAPADFAVMAAGTARTVSGVNVNGATVTLTLASPVGHGQTVTVSYTPGTNKIRDRWGNGAAQIAGRSVRNDSLEPSLSIEPVTVGEGGGAASFTVRLNVSSGEQVTVDYATADGTAAMGSDYTAASGALTFAPGETAKPITVMIADDAVDEDDESFSVTLSEAVNASIEQPAAAGTIEDDDTRGVRVSRTALLVAEGGNSTYTVVLSSQPTGPVTVTPSVSDNTDVTPSPPVLTFTATTWNAAQTVTVTAAQDTDAEEDTATVAHTVAGADYGANSVTAADVAVTVTDDDTSSGVTLSVNPAAVAEDAGGTVVTVTAELAGGTRSAATTVAVAVGSGSAGLGTDFMAVNNFNVTIPGNTLSATGTFTLNPVNDTVDEPDETVLVMGTVTGTGLDVRSASVTITDNDATPAVTLLLSQGSIGENGGTAAVTASLNRASSVATTVEITAAPAGAVMPSVNTTLRFEAESIASTGTVMLTAVDNDIDAANLTVTVSGVATNSQGVMDPADLSLTITDDDTRGVTVSKSALTVDKGGTAAYTVVLDSQPAASVTVTPLRSSGDSDVTVSGPLIFTANNWDTPRTVTVSAAAEDSDTLDDTAVIGHTLAGGDYANVTADDVEVTVADGETTPVTGTGGRTTPGTGGGTTPVTPPAVPAPTGLEATEGANGIVLNWSAPAATTDTVDGYIVNRCEGAGCIPEYYYRVPSGTTYTDWAVAANTLYRYSVSAYFSSSDKTSDWSNVIERTTGIVGAGLNYRDQVQIMYVAYYGRPGDAGGLDFWATELEKVNGKLSRIINSFGNSEEFQDRFGDLDNEELVNNSYLQLLGRDADSGGLKFYVNGLREGRFTLASIALNVANGTQNLDEMIKANKLRAANAFTKACVEAGAAYGEFQIDDAKLWLAGVDSTSASITAALDSLPDLLEIFPEAMPPVPAEPVLEGSFIENINILKSSIRISPGTRVESPGPAWPGGVTGGVRLNEDTQHRLEALAKSRDRTPHYLMKAATERFLYVEEALEAEHQLVKSRFTSAGVAQSAFSVCRYQASRSFHQSVYI